MTIATKQIDLINPSTGEVFQQVTDASVEDMRVAIFAARQKFDSGVWSKMSFAERGIYLKKIIRDNAKELAELETRGTGKTSKQSTFIDVPTSAETFEYFSDAGEILKSRINQTTAPVKSMTVFEPMGVVGCIIPWNYPLIMFAWKVAPALIAGNTVIFKPSRLGCAAIMRLAALIEKIGLPEGVLNIVTTSDQGAMEELIRSPHVNMISFTGGTETGRRVMQLASATTKKVSLELGGKSPNIVFSDCNFDAALGGSMSAIFMNQGQMCTAGSRLFIEEKLYDQFLSALVEKTKNLKMGDASKPDTDFGPMVSKDHRDKVLKIIDDAKKEGAKVVCGGKIPQSVNSNGAYLEPTILTDVKNSMTIAQEEVFGPVLCVMKFSDENEVVNIANDSKYGLAACIWTKDLEKANRIASQLQCGTIWINTYGGFYDEASFGGYKQSGFGRELGIEGLFEYTQSKNICIDQTPGGVPLAASWF